MRGIGDFACTLVTVNQRYGDHNDGGCTPVNHPWGQKGLLGIGAMRALGLHFL